MGRKDGGWWLAALDDQQIQALPQRTRQGVVNASADLLASLGHQLQSFMPELTAVLLRFALASHSSLQPQVSN